jgi:hypothetical protein
MINDVGGRGEIIDVGWVFVGSRETFFSIEASRVQKIIVNGGED